MKKYKTGIVIGRFQPFHNGHKYLIKKALEFCEEIIIGIGSSNVSDDTNPYSFVKRKSFVKEFVKNENIGSQVKKIIAIPDHPNDDVWLSNVLKKSGEFDVSVGDNEWVNGIFEKAGIPVVRVGYYRRNMLEGTKIRKLMKSEEKWEDRVPYYLVDRLTGKK